MPRIFPTFLIWILVLGSLNHGAATCGGQASNLPTGNTDQVSPGAVIEQVICSDDPAQSYALYLPSVYSARKVWPVIYAFDAGARGSLPVERFKAAAEKYGYVIVGSNNSRNGPWGPNFSAAAAMWNDTHARFSLDSNRIYTTGFSGGARVACEIAYKPHYQVAGVIAHGAGFRQGHGPSAKIPFIFFGTAGNEDFNLLELQDLKETLENFGISNRLVTFDGPHDWAPDTICTKAVEWLELQAMKTGLRSRDEALIELIYQKRWQQACELEGSGLLYKANLEFQGILLDFEELRDIGEAKEKVGQLETAREIKRAKRQESKRRDSETQVLESIGRHFTSILDPAQRSEAVSALIRIARKHQEPRGRKTTPEEALMKARIRNYISTLAYTDGAAYVGKKYYPEAVAVLDMWTVIEPEQHVPFYYLARAYAGMGDRDKALHALESAVERGFNDLPLMERDPYLSALDGEERYKRLVKRLKEAP
jgi:dienelactone hydrolase